MVLFLRWIGHTKGNTWDFTVERFRSRDHGEGAGPLWPAAPWTSQDQCNIYGMAPVSYFFRMSLGITQLVFHVPWSVADYFVAYGVLPSIEEPLPDVPYKFGPFTRAQMSHAQTKLDFTVGNKKKIEEQGR